MKPGDTVQHKKSRIVGTVVALFERDGEQFVKWKDNRIGLWWENWQSTMEVLDVSPEA